MSESKKEAQAPDRSAPEGSDAADYEQRFLSLYAAVSDPDSLERALETVAVRRRLAAALGVGDDALSSIVSDGDSRRQLAARLRARPDLVAALAAPDASVAGAVDARYLMHALGAVPKEGAPPDEVAQALRSHVRSLAERYGKVTGERLDVDIAPLIRAGRAALVHLLHTSPRFPGFGEMFQVRRRLSATPPSRPTQPRAEESVPARREAPTPTGDGPRQPTSGKEDESAEARAAAIESVLGRCATTPSTSAENKIPFPTQLDDREDIYYDFSIVVPIDHGEEPADLEREASMLGQLNDTSTVAFNALVSAALSVVAALEQAKLTDIYGPTLITDIARFLSDVTQRILDPHSWFREGLRRTAREYAAALRLVARIRLNIAPGESDVLKEAEKLALRLEAADTGFSFSLQSQVRLPKQMGSAAHGELTMYNALPSHHEDRGDVLSGAGVAQLPDAAWQPFAKYGNPPTNERWYNWLYGWGDIPQLRQYLDDLARKYPELIGLRDLVREAAKSLRAIKNEISTGAVGDPEYRKRMQQILNGLVNDSAYSLATLLEEIAELIEVPAPRRDESGWIGRRLPYAKRLALQIVYRQTWRPTGYSKGKMVGYKTLLPGESQQIKRRTFVKTTTESTTAEDFAASRQNDFSSTQRETSDVLRETGDKFDFRASASGHVDFAVAGAEVKAETGVALAGTSRNVRNSITESTTKGAVTYSNKREVKVRELVETEVTDESVSSIANGNQEITANYFYYQLYRNYDVSTILYDVRPVLLVARDYPTPAQVDEAWLGKHMHDILFALPPQLAADATGAVNTLEAKSRKVVRARSASARAQAEYELLRDAILPSIANPSANPATLDDRQREALTRAATSAAEAHEALTVAESDYLEATTRVSRVVSHVRENILMYMHRIWQAGSDVDRQNALRGERFFNVPVDRVTRGLNRLGYLASEEIYEYTGKSAVVLEALTEFMISGAQVMALPDGTPIKEQLIKRYEVERGLGREEAIDYIKQNIVVTDEDPNGATDVPRSVQLAQDAVAVEAMPGTTPLLEGFKLAHRALDVQRACLENQHLAARIVDRPWTNPRSRDDYNVTRSSGEQEKA